MDIFEHNEFFMEMWIFRNTDNLLVPNGSSLFANDFPELTGSGNCVRSSNRNDFLSC